MTAFVDESLRDGPGGLYVVGAVVVARDEIEVVRAAARAVLLRRQRRFHWHEESESQRRRMIGQIAELTGVVEARVYVCRPVAARREERARALCIDALLWDLWQADVDRVVLERRQEHNDRRDEPHDPGSEGSKASGARAAMAVQQAR